MDKFGLILRTIVFFLFPVPFLLSFAVGMEEIGRDMWLMPLPPLSR
jgi:hypothetical protein